MPALSDSRLRQLLLGALPGAVPVLDLGHTKPMVLDVPGYGLVRVYLWTTTPDASSQGRPAGEHKAQIIIPGTPRSSRQHLDLADMPVALLGYSPVFGLFTTWLAELHHDSAYSKNLQFKEALLEEAVQYGWAVDVRKTDAGPEVRVAVHPVHLAQYLTVMRGADQAGLTGEKRKVFFHANAPKSPLLLDSEELDSLTPLERRRVLTERKERDRKFAAKVRTAFRETCAVCGLQLNIVEAAHIIEVHDPRSRDELWNGISLCRNHHRLFDHHTLQIDPSGKVLCSKEVIGFLKLAGRLQGFEHCLEPYLDHSIRFPDYWTNDAAQRKKFQQALEARFVA